MHPFWNTITKVKYSSSYQFRLENKKFRVNTEVFCDILQICPKLPHQPFDIPPSTDEEIIATKPKPTKKKTLVKADRGKEEDGEEYVDEFTDKEDDVDNANEEYKEELDDAEELYKDVNVNLRKEDVEMTDADQSGADQHNKTKGPMQSSSVSSNFRKKILNFENVSPADNEIASLMDTTVRHENVFQADNEIASLMIHTVKYSH
ncbi:hypothetical protein Tco_0736344 [Tanacetum coccineum]